MQLTTAQAAERLGLTVRRVQAFIKGKRLPATKIGRDYLIDADDLKAFASKPRKQGRPVKR